MLFALSAMAQSPCTSSSLQSDSCNLLNPKNKDFADFMETRIKNDYQIQFVKHGPKYYLKIIVKNDLGFGRKGSLLLSLSNKKQIYVKSIDLNIIDKNSGYFILPLNDNNYLETIKDFGLSSILFKEKAEFVIPKNDSEHIKKTAACFFDVVKEHIKPPVNKF